MNKYPLWKNLLILSVVVIGLLYSAPNLYPPDPAVQISGASGSLEINQQLADKIRSTLAERGIAVQSDELLKNSVMVRFTSVEEQLTARSALESELGGDYVVAINMAPTTPEWLMSFGAKPMNLGLDLSGGVHFLLEVDTDSAIGKQLETYVEEIVDRLREAKLASRKWRVEQKDNTIQVSFPSVEVQQAAAKVLSESFPELLRFSDEETQIISVNLSDSAIAELEDYAVTQNLTSLRNRVNELGVSEPVVQRQGRNRIVVELPGCIDTAMCKRVIGKTANLEFRLEADNKTLKSRQENFTFRSEEYRNANLEKKIILSGDRVTNARTGFDPDTGLPQVNITLDSQGGKLMNNATKRNVGRRMGVLFIESKVDVTTTTNEAGEEDIVRTTRQEKSIISLATIQSALGVQFRITGVGSIIEANELALLLRAGALAAPVYFVEERTVGPSLGAESIAKGVMSVQIGFALVILFMIAFYRFFGVAASIALVVNLVVLVACMSLLGATLTLPGIAGIVLTVGMAVDANVLIFSRIKEELKNGHTPHMAINSGYDRAFVTILDANITTLLVALILYAVGTGPIQGFAITLAIGILSSMFTAIMLTRAIVNFWYGSKKIDTLSI